ncbi:MAG: NTP transferase domain-containing protein, partial [Proteobacteria bacterium]|nr:NTP transferase domain-containing protein [Pseudomonadota bacterium]
MSMIVPVILAGGGGTRLWPLSRDDHPKQFLPLLSKRSLFIDTILRLWKAEGFSAPLVTCGAHHRFAVAAELEEAGVAPAAILTEPAARNTAPAAAAAALLASELFGPDVVLAILPADHFIGDGEALRSALRTAADGAGAKNGGHIVALGIRPQSPDTGYGYIEIGDHIAGTKIHRIVRFVEKPDAETARRFLATDRFLWNAGMFVVPVGVLAEEMQRHCPEV